MKLIEQNKTKQLEQLKILESAMKGWKWSTKIRKEFLNHVMIYISQRKNGKI